MRIILLLLSASTLYASTLLTSIKGSVTLKKEGSPYIVETNLYNNKLDTLTVESGVIITFKNYTKLFLRGHVRFLGLKNDKIVLHSENPNANWVGLHIHGSPSPIVMKNVVIMNSFKNSFLNSSGTINEMQFINNHYGLWIENTHNFKINRSEFTQNRYGITVANGSVSVDNSRIEHNAFGTYLELDGTMSLNNTPNQHNKIVNSLNMNSSPVTNKKVAKSIWKSIEATF